MKITLYFEDKNFSNMDFSRILDGNPGIGGTEYEFALLATMLSTSNGFEVTIIHQNPTNVFTDSVITVLCNDFDIWDFLVPIDIFIFKSGKQRDWYERLAHSDLKSICWAHNFLSYKELTYTDKCNCLKRIVFVGRQQYDHHFDHRAVRKMTYIYNMCGTKDDTDVRNEEFDNNVTYTGSLISLKGFHVLAKCWKEVVTAVPDSKLHVIGTGKLYRRDAKLGKYGIADDSYENQFMPFLLNDDREILDSVIFHGVVGAEKKDIYKNTAVGIENPSAHTETFGISGIEMIRMGIPVVTKAENGFLDTVPHGKAGFLFEDEKDFSGYIIRLLKDHDLNKSIAVSGRKYAIDSFSAEYIINNWIQLINDAFDEKPARILYPETYLNKDNKKLRIAIFKCHTIPILAWVPSFHAYVYLFNKLKGIVKKIIRRDRQ